MFDLFLDIFSYRENVLTRLDPRTKIITALMGIFCIILSTYVYLPLAVFALCLTILIRIKIPPWLIFVHLALPLGFVLVLVILQVFTSRWLRTGLTIGGMPVLQAGFLMGSKVMGSISIILLLSTVTPAHKIFTAMRALHVPTGWVEIAMLMYHYIFTLLEHASEAACAQRVRLGHLGMRRSLSSLGTLAGAVLLRSIDQAKLTHEAMVLRGYTGMIPFGALPPLSRKDILQAVFVCTAFVGAFAIMEWR